MQHISLNGDCYNVRLSSSIIPKPDNLTIRHLLEVLANTSCSEIEIRQALKSRISKEIDRRLLCR